MSALVEFDLALHSEIQIDGDAAAVWSSLDRLREWKASVVSVERLAGAPDSVGEVLRVGQRPASETVHVLHTTLRLSVPRWRIQRLATEDGVSTTGYVIYCLVEQPLGSGPRTLLLCDVVSRVRLPEAAAAQAGGLERLASQANHATQEKLDADHLMLKRLVETSLRAGS